MDSKVTVKFLPRDLKYLPTKKKDSDAGYDLKACADNSVDISEKYNVLRNQIKWYLASKSTLVVPVFVDGIEYFWNELELLDSKEDIIPANTRTQSFIGWVLGKVDEKNFEVILPGKTKLISTGLKVKMDLAPPGYNHVMLLYPRSGLATKCDLKLANSVGVTDQDYNNDEVKLAVRNESDKMHIITDGARIAQALFQRVLDVNIEVVAPEDWDVSTDRLGGFGSSGV